MTATVASFRWLDLLEKEFDKGILNINLLLDDLEENEEVDNYLHKFHSKLSSLTSCFAQLSHKAQTIFQVNAKLEAEVLNLKHELTHLSAGKNLLEKENYDILRQLHASQLKLHEKSSSADLSANENAENIRGKLERELDKERTRRLSQQVPVEELVLLKRENECLRKDNLNLQSELTGAKLTAKYLDKELAGRIQQLQLLGREMSAKEHETLWKHLEAEIQLHRHKTVVRACRTQRSLSPSCTEDETRNLESSPAKPDSKLMHRIVKIRKSPQFGLGISITGGREHGIPILISAIYPDLLGADAKNLFVGDTILSANGCSLSNASHKEAVDLLSSLEGEIQLELMFVSPDDENDENRDNVSFNYRWFDDEVVSIPESFQPLQNGRLSRASIDSVRGSTENVLNSDSPDSHDGEFSSPKTLNEDSPSNQISGEDFGNADTDSLLHKSQSIEKEANDATREESFPGNKDANGVDASRLPLVHSTNSKNFENLLESSHSNDPSASSPLVDDKKSNSIRKLEFSKESSSLFDKKHVKHQLSKMEDLPPAEIFNCNY